MEFHLSAEQPISPSEHPNDENLFALIAGRARRCSDGQLVVAAAVGLGGAVLIGLIRPAWWVAILPLLTVGSFGVWGIADRTAAERAATNRESERLALAGVRLAAAVVGTAAGALAILVIVARMIGTWVS